MVKLTKSLKKELHATIRQNFKRYLSLLAIIFLGVMFYVGMKSSAPVLQKSIVNYIEDKNYMDIEIASVIGFTNSELESLKSQVPEIQTIEGGYETDITIDFGNKSKEAAEKNVAIKSYSDKQKINRLYLLQGREATKAGEVIADGSLVGLGYKLGDTITIDNLDCLKIKDLTIVGFARSPEFISSDKGSSKLTSGKINYFLYVHEDSFEITDGFYNVAKIELKDKYKAFTTKYNNYVNVVKDKIEKLSNSISKDRKEEYLNSKQQELDAAKEEYEIKKTDYTNELNETKQKLDAANAEIKSAEANIMTDSEVDIYLAYTKTALDSTKEQLEMSKQTLDLMKSMIDSFDETGDISSNDDLASLNAKLTYWTNKLKGYEDELASLENQLNEKKVECSKISTDILESACSGAISALESRIESVHIKVTTTKNNINAINQVLIFVKSFGETTTSISEYLSEKEQAYNEALAKYNSALAKYNDSKANLKSQMQEARELVESKKAELDAANEEYEKNYKTLEVELENNQTLLDEAETTILKLNDTNWYLFTRNDSNGYSQFYDDIERINNLAKILPIIFFIVAGLVTSSSISRMATEDREKMGVLKSLGYTNKHILYKYIWYSLSAAIIGSILGVIAGVYIFPLTFSKIYSILYYFVNIKYTFYFRHLFFAVALSLIATVGVAYFSVENTLRETASNLMRPKEFSSKKLKSSSSKRWKRLSLYRKITIRNIFINKGKSLMTLLGVVGCTALIVTGFGAREAVSSIIYMQYGDIFNISSELFYKDDLTEYEIEESNKNINESDEIELTALAKMESVTIKTKNNSKSFEVSLVVPQSLDDYNRMVDLESTSGKSLELSDDGVILTEKIAKHLKVKVGDTITYTDSNNLSYSVKVSGITKNYVYHYIYMTSNLYKKLTNNEIRNNLLLLKFKDGVNVAKATSKIYDSGDISSYLSLVDAKSAYDDIISRFNLILFVIIISAALLAYVVLYNLAKINLSEKNREIATLKVLGFRPKEVNNYINREMIALIITGMLIGLICGIFLTEAVVSMCELDNIMFYHGVSYSSLIYAVVLTSIFAMSINMFVKKDIKKINMVESLKSSD